MPLTAGAERLFPKLTGIPSATKPTTARFFSPAVTSASRRSLRMRKISRKSMANAPAIHIPASTTAVRPCVIFHMGPPIAPSGVAHLKCGAQSLSITAAVGTMKLSAVTTQTQYFVVALGPRMVVSSHAAAPTMDAYSRWTLK